MVYDERISADVPLSKVLDHFLESGEHPSVIVKFLKLYEKDFTDILQSSRMFVRMIGIDFASHLKPSELSWLIENGLDCKFKDAARLVWQFLVSDADSTIKSDVRRFISRIIYEHPHRGFIGVTARRLDLILAHWNKSIYEIAHELNDLDFNEYTYFMGSVTRSVFITRMLQSDFFNCLETKRQYVFIHSVFEGLEHLRSIENFLFQIMSENHPVEMKKEIFNFFRNIGSNPIDNDFLPENIRKKVSRAKNWPEVAIYVNLTGMENMFPDLVFHLIMVGNLKLLFSILDNEPELFREHFDIIDVLDQLRVENEVRKLK